MIAPSLTSENAFLKVGNLSEYIDYGCLHNYYGGFFPGLTENLLTCPGTTGWGGTDQYGTYGSLQYNKNLAAILAGTKPIVTSETGQLFHCVFWHKEPEMSGGVYLKYCFFISVTLLVLNGKSIDYPGYLSPPTPQSHQDVPQDIQAKWIPRVLFNQWNNGIPYTTIYQVRICVH